MGEVKNFTLDEVMELTAKFPWTPLSNKVIITINTTVTEGDVITSDSSFSEEQFVVAVGDTAKRFVQEGDTILLDVERMTEKVRVDYDQTQVVPRVKIDPIYTEYGTFAIINDQFIKAVKNV